MIREVWPYIGLFLAVWAALTVVGFLFGFPLEEAGKGSVLGAIMLIVLFNAKNSSG